MNTADVHARRPSHSAIQHAATASGTLAIDSMVHDCISNDVLPLRESTFANIALGREQGRPTVPFTLSQNQSMIGGVLPAASDIGETKIQADAVLSGDSLPKGPQNEVPQFSHQLNSYVAQSLAPESVRAPNLSSLPKVDSGKQSSGISFMQDAERSEYDRNFTALLRRRLSVNDIDKPSLINASTSIDLWSVGRRND